MANVRPDPGSRWVAKLCSISVAGVWGPAFSIGYIMGQPDITTKQNHPVPNRLFGTGPRGIISAIGKINVFFK